jgi:hypothetical protein
MVSRLAIIFKSVFLSFFVLSAIFSSCKKKKDDNNRVTFTNQINERINLVFYTSAQDYATNTNPHLEYTLAANERHIFEEKSFKAGSEYYIDWYSNDFRYNNWYNDLYNSSTAPYARIVPTPGNNTYYTNASYLSDNRAVFLDNNKTNTKWKAIDYYGYSLQTGYVSLWNSLKEHEKFREVIVNKNFKANYTYKNAQGEIKSREIDFKVHHTSQAYIEFFASSEISLGHMISGKLPSGQAPNYYSESKDSVLALLPDAPESYFLMVRQ